MGKVLLVITLVLGYVTIARVVNEVKYSYEYERTVSSYWSLSEKASTLAQKSTYLDQYVQAIETAGLSGNDAIVFTTPDNSYEQNMTALKSFQGRMHQIQGMDEQSFAYQTAIQQITAQEQGEAGHLTGTFEGIWWLKHYPTYWGWIDLLFWIGILSAWVGLGCWAVYEYD